MLMNQQWKLRLCNISATTFVQLLEVASCRSAVQLWGLHDDSQQQLLHLHLMQTSCRL